ncbi:zinc finger protein 668-like [Pezoporus flaviventris]|uniref:zinc finger protein 668-like n=1 Tax=Pezoporus flaviventris TaxID=889875 RepID=UPI002AB242B5|nr:zinc finger protein 668-like [Pezoporus flaviventris]
MDPVDPTAIPVDASGDAATIADALAGPKGTPRASRGPKPPLRPPSTQPRSPWKPPETPPPSQMPPGPQPLLSVPRARRPAPPFPCPSCPKAYGSQSKLAIHQRAHTGERPFACPDCPKAFADPSVFRKHRRGHAGLRPHGCPLCPKAYAERKDLRNHQRVHTGERPFLCPHCGKSFGRASSLACHQRIHAPHKPYGCRECGKAFTQLSSYQSHRRVHTGERPFLCPPVRPHLRRPLQLPAAPARAQRAQALRVPRVRQSLPAARGPGPAPPHPHRRPAPQVRRLREGLRGLLGPQGHRLSHSGDRPHKCGECGKGFGERGRWASTAGPTPGSGPTSVGSAGRASGGLGAPEAREGRTARALRAAMGRQRWGAMWCGVIVAPGAGANMAAPIGVQPGANMAAPTVAAAILDAKMAAPEPGPFACPLCPRRFRARAGCGSTNGGTAPSRPRPPAALTPPPALPLARSLCVRGK